MIKGGYEMTALTNMDGKYLQTLPSKYERDAEKLDARFRDCERIFFSAVNTRKGGYNHVATSSSNGPKWLR